MTDQTSRTDAASGDYVVVARRYRPQTFEQLIGQQHVAKALTSAITSNRVGHAYLFTGARGVGKTSAARILAKALNCEQGPTPTPCNECDNCRSISTGNDVDVLEIDGASNRGIDEIRQLRQNANVRPSRARFKIYIIDEVHMLTREAFNALLKTLEEPPDHVKFIFATTEPNKIPITILSRCQRFDFAGIDIVAIEERLRQIVSAEGVEVEDEAISVIARRAAGSMRDSQSLLEQLLGLDQQKITAADVHALLGTAPAARLQQIVAALVDHDAAAALVELDAALQTGTEPAELLDQLWAYFRDVMAATVGCGSELMLHTMPGEHEVVRNVASKLGADTVLAIVQILEETSARLRSTYHPRTVVEMALVRIAQLEDLSSVFQLLKTAQAGGAIPNAGRAVAPAKKNAPVAASKPASVTAVPSHSADATSGPSSPVADTAEQATVATAAPATEAMPLCEENLDAIWKQVLASLDPLTAGAAAVAEGLTLTDTNRVAVTFAPQYNFHRQQCEAASARDALGRAMQQTVGCRVKFDFRTGGDAGEQPVSPPRPKSHRELVAEVRQRDMVQRAIELFGGQDALQIDPPKKN